MREVDVVVAGGSIAGLAAAAALRESGMSVVVVEPGQRTDRRLAGEMIHPLGVAGLRELGLFAEEAFAEAVMIHGFAVIPDAGDASSKIALRYGRQAGRAPCAMAVDYGLLRRNLDQAARRLDHISFIDDARVKSVDLTDPKAPVVSIEAPSGLDVIRCRMLVVADGAASAVRSMVGIAHSRRSISNISGYVVENAALPAPGFGHVIMGGSSVVLAYEIGNGRARVMFDQPLEQDGLTPVDHREALLAAIPEPFRHQVAETIRVQKPLGFRSAEVIAEATHKGAVVLVGDAGGSCHPLTATGMTVGISDGIRLRDALRRHPADFEKAFRHYGRARRRTQRSRRMVATALHDVCSRREPELRVVRSGLLRYWRRDDRSAAATMAILAMTDLRISSAFWQFLKVIRHGLVEYWCNDEARRQIPPAKLVTALGSMTIQRVGASLRAR
ncbi:NAD(P)/FAD-dependent oxidoreductase [Lichenihabitans sp. Uapishka_5]|uniref:FAD-dependent oxidoreductase n=1 Tax=Lichenihabitans sp. Uapishka_5 TaxID=3037302 RepID=UPI0029E81B4C|nr:NAD(P)/FAD-dependent oxidoreductase [Lichenihabitans sp. Uapishka_5]MDX7949698.1 NAD(P)/FAD-dependent oxidoreductase [Lichenihabitans sp. Uapishka_5]